jgi:L-alanine-DL-glutamate epimerase-like enolase superfamily enzyme
VPEAVQILRRWDAQSGLDFCEAPGHPVTGMREVREQTSVCISPDEWLWGPAEPLGMIDGRGADVLCFCAYWVVIIRRFVNLALVVWSAAAACSKSATIVQAKPAQLTRTQCVTENPASAESATSWLWRI